VPPPLEEEEEQEQEQEQEEEEEKAAAGARDTDRAGGAEGGGQDTHGDSEKALVFPIIYQKTQTQNYQPPD